MASSGGFWRGAVCQGMAGNCARGNNMAYQWKIPVAPVSAQTAGEEFERLYRKHGKLAPEDVVEESRDASAPLHGCFEWNDAIAAEKYRVHQAGDIIRALVISEDKGEAPRDTRAFVHVRSDYHPISVVVDDAAMLAELLASAEKEMTAFQRKYETLQELSPVMDAIRAYQQKNA